MSIANFATKYKVIDKIGEGSFSEVLKIESKSNYEMYAAKKLRKSFHNIKEVCYCAEIVAMQKLSKHTNVLHMIEYFYDAVSGKALFVFELMDMSMFDYLKIRKRPITETKARSYLYQMLKGLEHLHKNGLFHRDIKPENILIKFAPSDAQKLFNVQAELIKIADLGSIRGIYSKAPYTEYISTRWYRSPECLLTKGHYGHKMDIWAAGCVFYEIMTMKPLFPGSNEIDQLAKIHAILGTPNTRILNKLKSKSKNCIQFVRTNGTGLNHLLNNYSEDSKNVLRLMLQYDPDARSNCRRLLEHHYFGVLRDNERNMSQETYNKMIRMNKMQGDGKLNVNTSKLHNEELLAKKLLTQKKAGEILESKTAVEFRHLIDKKDKISYRSTHSTESKNANRNYSNGNRKKRNYIRSHAKTCVNLNNSENATCHKPIINVESKSTIIQKFTMEKEKLGLIIQPKRVHGKMNIKR